MSPKIPRRDFLGLAAAVPGVVLLRLTPAQAATAGPRRLFVYEAGLPERIWRPVALRQAPMQARALEGDRVRCARALLAAGPQTIGGLTRYADLLILAGTAEEAGYRLGEQVPLPRSARQPALIVWTMEHRLRGSRPLP